MKNHRKRILHLACEDGARCRRKRLGLKGKGGKLYDYAAWDVLFARHYRPTLPGLDLREEAFECWKHGWHDEDERLSCLVDGYYPCGRPV